MALAPRFNSETTFSSFVRSIDGVVPGLSKTTLRDLIKIHGWYIQGNTSVSLEIGPQVRMGRHLLGREVFIIPKKGTIIDLFQKVGEGVDKIAKKVLYIDARGSISQRVLSSPKRGCGERYPQVAAVSKLFHSDHVLRFDHVVHANRHFLLSDLKYSDANKFFCHWDKRYDPTRVLCDVFIGAFEGLSAIHEKGYIHSELQNPGNILVQKSDDGLTGIIGDLDQTRIPDSSRLEKLKAQDVRGIFLAFTQVLVTMKEKGIDLSSLESEIDRLRTENLSPEKAKLSLQNLKKLI